MRVLGSAPLLLAALVAALVRPAAAYDVQGHVGGKRTLVLVDSMEVKETHSAFFAGIAARGHELSFQVASSPEVSLYKYGVPRYDNLLLFAPSTEQLAGGLDAAGVLGFVEQGGNLIMTGDKDMSELMREIAAEFGVAFDRRRTAVIDHFNYEPALDKSGQHTAVISGEVTPNARVVGAKPIAPVLFRGLGHSVDKDNILALPVLRGGSSAYSATLTKDMAAAGSGSLELAGKRLGLISAVQARNNARAVISGSLDFFSDEFFGATLSGTGKAAGNKALALELSKWALGERGILRASNVTHHRADGTEAEHLLATKEKPDLPFSLFPDPELNRQSLVYRIKDDIVYSMVIEEYDAEQGGWVPYKADDVQLEFVMLDPYVRTFLQHDGQGRFAKLFKVPDAYGVYKFRVMYRRPGLSTLAVNTQVSVRPFHHDEYERFIFSAFPYYASAFSMMAGFLVFGAFFLYSERKPVPAFISGAGSSANKKDN